MCHSCTIPFITIDLTITAIIITGWGWQGTDMKNRHHTVGRQDREGGQTKTHSPSLKATLLLHN